MSMQQEGFIVIDEGLIESAGQSHGNNYVRFRVDCETRNLLQRHLGQHIELAVRLIDSQGTRYGQVSYTDAFGGFSEYLDKCIKAGVFNKIDVLSVLGTDKDYQAYCRLQPCELTGAYAETLRDGTCKSIYAHVSDSSRPVSGGMGAGTNKPIYSGIPLRQDLHTQQHMSGWISLMNQFSNDKSITEKIGSDALRDIRLSDTDNPKKGLEWAKLLRNHRLNLWAVSRLAGALKTEHTPGQGASNVLLVDWATKHN
ncbi:MAG: hypothetical protein GY938_29405, partial [Ketobacter sp.]|nr:hypothetical protein [Ketobacter sp.]